MTQFLDGKSLIITNSDLDKIRTIIANNIRGDGIYENTSNLQTQETSNSLISCQKLKHFIVTRFNLWDENLRRSAGILEPTAYERWIDRRISIFERTLLPTIVNQLHKDFKIILFFDTEINDAIQAFIDKLRQYEMFLPVFLDQRQPHAFASFEKALAEKIIANTNPDDVIATTRVDSDDALNVGFIFNLNQYCCKMKLQNISSGLYLNFPIGLQSVGADLYFLAYNRNPFQTMLEPRDKYLDANIWVRKGIFQTAHDRTFKVAKVLNIITSFPMWVQFVHGGNVSNAARTSLPKFEVSDHLRIMFAGTIGGLLDLNVST